MPLADPPVADVIRRVLIDLGLGADPEVVPLGNWPVYVDVEPDRPDNCLTVEETQGTDSGRTAADGEVLTHYGFQVRVRAVDSPTGRAKAGALRAAFQDRVNQMVVTGGRLGSARWLVPCVAGIGQVLSIGQDTPRTKRSLFTLNAKSALRAY